MPSDLDLLQGSWRITALEVEGREMPEEMLVEGRITIQGDRFTSTGMGAEYTGTIALDAAASPRRFEMHFDAGPEKGNTNFGIYELEGDRWRICLATRGAVRPSKFDSTEGGGFVLETLARGAAPVDVKRKGRASGKAAPKAMAAGASGGPATEFEGEWPMVSGVMSGKPMDQSLVKWVKRVTRGNQTTVLAGPQVMMKVEFSSDSSQSPKAIDYLNLAGANQGKTQWGIFELAGDVLRVCVAAPGDPRPAEFASVPGDGRTLTVWKRG